jgi:hypothetical protein
LLNLGLIEEGDKDMCGVIESVLIEGIEEMGLHNEPNLYYCRILMKIP